MSFEASKGKEKKNNSETGHVFTPYFIFLSLRKIIKFLSVTVVYQNGKQQCIENLAIIAMDCTSNHIFSLQLYKIILQVTQYTQPILHFYFGITCCAVQESFWPVLLILFLKMTNPLLQQKLGHSLLPSPNPRYLS